jgi:hypothetical protein
MTDTKVDDYRLRAERLRRAAKCAIDPAIAWQFNQLTEQYDRLVDEFERHHKLSN